MVYVLSPWFQQSQTCSCSVMILVMLFFQLQRDEHMGQFLFKFGVCADLHVMRDCFINLKEKGGVCAFFCNFLRFEYVANVFNYWVEIFPSANLQNSCVYLKNVSRSLDSHSGEEQMVDASFCLGDLFLWGKMNNAVELRKRLLMFGPKLIVKVRACVLICEEEEKKKHFTKGHLLKLSDQVVLSQSGSFQRLQVVNYFNSILGAKATRVRKRCT